MTRKIEGLSLEAYEARAAEGRDAARTGASRKANPYDFTDDNGRWSHWNSGYSREVGSRFEDADPVFADTRAVNLFDAVRGGVSL